MAEVLNSLNDAHMSSFNNDEENKESPGLVLDGPYAHIFLANFQRQLQQSVNAGKKFHKNRRGMSHRLAENEIEPPKHEPPPKPLPADNLKPSIRGSSKKAVLKGKKVRKKVTWAPGVYDPAPSADSHAFSDTSEWPKNGNKSKKGGNINPQTPPSNNAPPNALNTAGSSSDSENNWRSGKKGHKGGNIAAGEGSSKGDKGKDKKWERSKGGKKK